MKPCITLSFGVNFSENKTKLKATNVLLKQSMSMVVSFEYLLAIQRRFNNHVIYISQSKPICIGAETIVQSDHNLWW